MAILPVHSSGKGLPSQTYRKLREKVLLLLVFVGFLLICFGAFGFVPDMFDVSPAKPSAAAGRTLTNKPEIVEVIDKPQIPAHPNGDHADRAKADVEDPNAGVTNAVDADLDSLDKSSPEHHRLFVKKVCQLTI